MQKQKIQKKEKPKSQKTSCCGIKTRGKTKKVYGCGTVGNKHQKQKQ